MVQSNYLQRTESAETSIYSAEAFKSFPVAFHFSCSCGIRVWMHLMKYGINEGTGYGLTRTLSEPTFRIGETCLTDMGLRVPRHDRGAGLQIVSRQSDSHSSISKLSRQPGASLGTGTTLRDRQPHAPSYVSGVFRPCDNYISVTLISLPPMQARE